MKFDRACNWDFEILVNNAGMGEGGPIAEIPLKLVRNNFEINVFLPLHFTQRVVRNWVTNRVHGKVVFVSSMGGLFSPPGFCGLRCHQNMPSRQLLKRCRLNLDLLEFKYKTINPGAFLTGFNEAMAENAFRWLDEKN